MDTIVDKKNANFKDEKSDTDNDNNIVEEYQSVKPYHENDKCGYASLNPGYNVKEKKVQCYSCNICNTSYANKRNFEEHCLTIKHQNNTSGINNNIFECKICEIQFSSKKNLQKHLLSIKHKNKNKSNEVNEPQSTKTKKTYSCPKCDKEYAYHSGLWRHMQKDNCNSECDETLIHPVNKKITTNEFTPELIAMIMQNMQQMMIEQNKAMLEIAKNAGNNNNNSNNNNTINNDNKSFNLNFFLNERCKNAMNLSDFVNGVDISLDDFEETGRIGYVEGLSRIFCKELQKLDIYERPIHCSDVKRETIYIRENNRWEKDENKERLLRAVKQIGKKNIKVLTLWQEKYPGYKDVESKENDRYLHILTNIMCGESEEEIQSNYGKIMKNISRITVVDKEKNK